MRRDCIEHSSNVALSVIVAHCKHLCQVGSSDLLAPARSPGFLKTNIPQVSNCNDWELFLRLVFSKKPLRGSPQARFWFAKTELLLSMSIGSLSYFCQKCQKFSSAKYHNISVPNNCDNKNLSLIPNPCNTKVRPNPRRRNARIP